MKIKNILFPIAPGQHLIDDHPVLAFADKVGASVTLISVIEELSGIRRLLPNHLSTLDVLDESKKLEAQKLNALKSQWLQVYPSLKINVEVAAGIAFIQIIEFAHQHNFDVIALSARMQESTRNIAFGSTTRHLLRKSTKPVLTASDIDSLKEVQRIVAAVDVSSEDTNLKNLNLAILRSAFDLGRIYGATVVVTHVWRLEGEGYLRSWGRKSELDIALLSESERSNRSAALYALNEELDEQDSKHHIQLVEGLPQEAIPQIIEKQNVDLLVMGTVCRTGVPGFIIGNTAETMINSVNCSVLALKPEGFVSPLNLTRR